MFIYHIFKETQQVTRVEVEEQLCSKCVLAHAKQVFDNRVLTEKTISFLNTNRNTIIDHVTCYDAVFKTINNGMLIVKNAIPLKNTDKKFLQSTFSYLSDCPIEFDTQYTINTDFHNHHIFNNISINLSGNNIAALVVI